MQGQKAVCAQEKIGFHPSEKRAYAAFEPKIPENRVPGGRPQDHRRNILTENNLFAVSPVKQKIKVCIRVGTGYPFQCFKGEPAYTVQFAGHQKPGIYCNGPLLYILVQLARNYS